jgi:hypothetical protein
LSFTSPNYLAKSASLFVANEGVIFVVCKKNAPATGGQLANIITLGVISHGIAGSLFMTLMAVDTLAGFVTNSYSINMATPSLDTSFGVSGANGTLLTTKKTNTNLEAKRDGVLVNTSSGSQSLGNNYNIIGQFFNSAQTFEGEIYEIIIYENLISDAEIITVENYLKNKYAIV